MEPPYNSMMYSYPNHIPLHALELQAIIKKVSAIGFDTLYGAFSWQDLPGNAREIFLNSVKRYAGASETREPRLDPFRGG